MNNLLWLLWYKWIKRKCPHICVLCKFKRNGNCLPNNIINEVQ